MFFRCFGFDRQTSSLAHLHESKWHVVRSEFCEAILFIRDLESSDQENVLQVNTWRWMAASSEGNDTFLRLLDHFQASALPFYD
jgi:hypothetical protein